MDRALDPPQKCGFRFSGVSISRLESTPNGAFGETSISRNNFFPRFSLFYYHETTVWLNWMLRTRRNASEACRTRFQRNSTPLKRKHRFPLEIGFEERFGRDPGFSKVLGWRPGAARDA